MGTLIPLKLKIISINSAESVYLFHEWNYMLYQFIFRVKNMISAKTANKPILPASNANDSNCSKIKINPNEVASINVRTNELDHFLRNVREYSRTIRITDTAEIK